MILADFLLFQVMIKLKTIKSDSHRLQPYPSP